MGITNSCGSRRHPKGIKNPSPRYIYIDRLEHIYVWTRRGRVQEDSWSKELQFRCCTWPTREVLLLQLDNASTDTELLTQPQQGSCSATAPVTAHFSSETAQQIPWKWLLPAQLCRPSSPPFNFAANYPGKFSHGEKCMQIKKNCRKQKETVTGL